MSRLVGIVLCLAAWGGVAAGAEGPGTSQAAVPGEGEAARPLVDLSGQVPHWAQRQFFGVAVWQFAAAFLFVLLGLALRKVSDHFFKAKLIPLLEKTRYEFDHLVAGAASGPIGVLVLVLGLYGAFAVLPLSPGASRFVFGALKVVVAGDVVWFLFRVVDIADRQLRQLAARTESRLDDQLVPVIRKALKVTIGVIGFVWVVQLLGYSVSSLIAGLGIGGLALALALQDTLGNFFGSVFIFLDRPFGVGDWVKIGDVEGVVEDIGFRSTRIRTWPTTLVSIPNKAVASSTIDNWSRMPKRRVVQTVGVTYETTADQMEEAVAGIRGILEADEGVDQEFMVVRFSDFGDSSLNILVYYFTKATAFADHMATRERVNLAIMRLLDSLGLSIAFPSRTLYLEGPVAHRLLEGLDRRLADEQETLRGEERG